MKVIHKYFVIALLLSLLFSVGAVAAQDIQENMTFEQSNMGDVSQETISTSLDDAQEIKEVEKDTSLDQSEADETKLDDAQEIKDDSLLAQGEDNDELGAGEKKFSDLQTQINGASAGGNLFLNGATYIPDSTNPIIINKKITIIGGSKLGDGKYATLDARGLSNIIKLGNGNIVFNSIIFANAISYGNGAAIYYQTTGSHSTTPTFEFNNCQFINNTASSGSAIYLEDYYGSSNRYFASLIVKNSFFINNLAHNSGAAIYTSGYVGSSIVNSSFINNSAGTGGAIQFGSTSSNQLSHISSSKFINNRASSLAGAVYSDFYTQIESCLFTNNSAQSAGALYFYSNGDNFPIRNSNFTNNSADFYGGAIFYNYYSGQIWDCKFTDNYASLGGAIFIPKSNNERAPYVFKILSSEFKNNTASLGGAIYNTGTLYHINAPRLEILSSKFNSNIADYGGAIYDAGRATYISNNQFSGNNALKDDSNSIFMTLNDEWIRIYGKIGNLVPDKRLSGNVISGDKTEIVFDKSTFGLVNIKLLDISHQSYNKVVTLSEGKIKIYATMKTKDGNYKVSLNNALYNLTFYNRTDNKYNIIDSKSFTFKDGYGEIEYDAQLGIKYIEMYGYPNRFTVFKTDDSGSKTYDANDPTTALTTTVSLNFGSGSPFITLDIVPLEYYIEFNDSEGQIGDFVQVPVTVTDLSGNPAEGDITVRYLGNELNRTLTNGKATLFITLPDTASTFDLSVQYKTVIKTQKVTVTDPKEIVVANLEITMPSEITGHVGHAITIPVQVSDGNNPYNGEITVQYQGGQKVEVIEDGVGEIILSLPTTPTEFTLLAQAHNAFAVCRVKVVDNSVPIEDEKDVIVVNVPSKMVGHAGKTVIIPIKVYDGDNNPLTGSVTVYANGGVHQESLRNGETEYVLYLPNKVMDLQVIVAYGKTREVTQIRVIDNSSTQPTDDNEVIINIGDGSDIVAPVGSFIQIPIYVHDSFGNELNGDVKITYNGHENTIPLTNGRATEGISLPINPTTYVLTVDYEGESKSVFIDIVDTKNPLGNLSNVESQQNGKVVISLPKDAEGTVIVTIGGKNYSGVVENGQVVIYIDDLPNGEYDATVHYTGDDTYSDSDKPITIVIKDSEVVDSKNPLGDLSELATNSNGQVVVNLPKDAAGEVVVTVNGKVFSATVHNGNAILDLSELPNGNFTGTVLYTGDEAHNYSPSSKSVVVVINTQGQVNPSNPLENINQISSSDDGKLEIPFPEDATGMVKVTINGKDYYASVSGGMVILDTSDVPTGSYDATVTYTGDSKYKGSEINIPITINQGQSPDPTNPMRDVTEVTSGEDGKLEIPFPSDATGMVKVTINGKDYYGSVVNGKVVIDTSDLPAGNYNATVTYTGDTKYSGSEKTVPVTIPDDPKNPMKDVTEVKSGEDGKLEIPFPEDAAGMVRVTINGKDYYGSVVNGKVVIDTSDLPSGNYTATVIYTGDTKYSGSEKTVPVTIKEEADPTNPMKDVTEVKSGDDSKLEIPFPSDATGNVVVNINGKDYPATIVDGKVVLDTSQIPVGNYTAVVKYEGDSKYSSSEKNVTVIIKEPADPTNPMKDITEVKSGDDGKVEIEFPTDATGMVVVNINGKDYPATIVDGKVSLDPKDVPAGNYTAVVKYSGDSKYSSSEKNVTVIIKEVVKPVDPTNPMGDITQTTSNDDGKVEIDLPKDATGSATVVINGKEYPAQIVDGKIVFDTKDVPQGNYNATVKYSGDGKYSPSEKTVTMIIKEYHSSTTNNVIKQPTKKVKKASKITAKKMTFKAKKKVKKYSITLKSGKTPLKKVQVTIKVGKKTYKAKTNAKGKATFKINKLTKKGKYTAVIKYKGDKTYKATSKKVKITVK